jgi:hypothetical protein
MVSCSGLLCTRQNTAADLRFQTYFVQALLMCSCRLIHSLPLDHLLISSELASNSTLLMAVPSHYFPSKTRTADTNGTALSPCESELNRREANETD